MNIKQFDVTMAGGDVVTMVEIETSEGHFTQMSKEHYNAQQAVTPPTFN